MVESAVVSLDQVWSSLEELCSMFSPDEWALETDCPGWTVQDQIAHLSGIESILLGRPQPKPLAKPWPAHVRDDLGALNEAQIEERRSWPPEDVLVEFMEITAERLKALTDVDDADWGKESQGVLGKAPLRDVIAIRAVDSVYHEQDIRRATENPGNLDGVAAGFVFDRMSQALPMVVAKRAKAPDGTAVVFEVAGQVGGTVGVTVERGRGALSAEAPLKPAVSVALDIEAYLCLMGGRWAADRVIKEGRAKISGDAELAGRILDSMSVTP